MKNAITIKSTRLLACLCLTALTGCGIYGTFDSKELTHIGEDAYGEQYVTPDGADSLGLSALDWKEIFTDPALQKLIAAGLENNADYRIAQLKCDEAEAALKASKLAYIPSFGANLEGSANGSVTDGGNTLGWSLPLSATWQIDIFGALTNAKRRSEAQLMQSQAYEQAVRSRVISTIAATYYSLVALDEQYRIYSETEQNWKESVETMKRLMEAGTYNASAVYQNEANYYGVCVSVIEIERQINELQNVMCSLLGMPSGNIERGSLADWTEPQVISAGIPVAALANRPDIKQAAKAYEAAFYNTGAAVSAMYPSLTITGTLNFAEMLYNAIGSLIQPIFQSGKLRANLKIARAQQEEAAITFRQSVSDAGIEVNDLLATIHSSQHKQEFYNRQTESLAKAVRSTELLMENGPVTYLEILTAQTSLLQARINEVSNRLAGIQGVISLYQALGGGAQEDETAAM